MPLRLLLCFLALTSIVSASSFDKPLSTQVTHWIEGKDFSGKVTCNFYPGFMVKEVDAGEVGAERLAIVPLVKGVTPPCTRPQDKAEMALDPKEWSGYFKGVKDNFVFFDADDGVNGGLGFAIYDAKTGKKLFEDSASGKIQFTEPTDKNQKPTMTYVRVVDGGCRLPKEGPACWEQIKKKIGDGVSQPDCKQGYAASARTLAKGRCQAQRTNTAACLAKELKLATEQTSQGTSVIAYPVSVVLGPHMEPKAVAGAARCWPSD